MLHHDRAVTRDELMEHISTEPDPQRFSASLSQTLSRLRNVLGSDRLEKLAGGAVRLRGPLRVDLADAEGTLKDGRLALGRGEWSAACEASRAALTELAGEVLAGDEADWLEPSGARSPTCGSRRSSCAQPPPCGWPSGATRWQRRAARSRRAPRASRRRPC